MPVGGGSGLEGPDYPGPGQPGLNVGIVGDVIVVIEIDKIVMSKPAGRARW